MPGPDLHVHSTASDGALTPAELVARAEQLGIPAIAITDHDTVDGLQAALEASATATVRVIPGVELSAAVGRSAVHILGYHVDPTRPGLLRTLEILRSTRIERAGRIVAALRADGIDISLPSVLDLADGGAVGRAHIAQLLVDTGHAASIQTAFREMLGSGAPYYVPKPVSPAADIVALIEGAGGVAVLAHPGLSMADALIPQLVDAGIVGLEAFHGTHSAADRVRYTQMAAEHDLVVTGGSDFHGRGHEGGDLGSADVPIESVSALDEAWSRRHART